MILSPALFSIFLVKSISFPFHFGHIEKLNMTAIAARDSDNINSCDCVVLGLGEVEGLMFAERTVKVAIKA